MESTYNNTYTTAQPSESSRKIFTVAFAFIGLQCNNGFTHIFTCWINLWHLGEGGGGDDEMVAGTVNKALPI